MIDDIIPADTAPAGTLHPEMLEEERAKIRAEMDLADVRIMRARLEGDTARIEAHIAAQAERRARLRGLSNNT